jgi:hypothetical protein
MTNIKKTSNDHSYGWGAESLTRSLYFSSAIFSYGTPVVILMVSSGNTQGGSITVPLTSCLTGLDQSVLQIKAKIVNCHTADSKPVKQKVSSGNTEGGSIAVPLTSCLTGLD